MRVVLAAFLISSGVASAAHAACSVTNAQLSFGQLDPTVGVAAVSGNINVTCAALEVFSVGLGNGLYFSGGERRLKASNSAYYLNYRLYKDVLQLSRFGDAVASERSGGVGLGIASTAIGVFGSVPGNQAAPAAAYSDTVTITVYY